MSSNPLEDRKAKQKADAKAMLAPKSPAPAGGSSAGPASPAPAQDAAPESMDAQGMEDARFASIEQRLAAVEAHCGISQPGEQDQDAGAAPAPEIQPDQGAPALY